MNNKKDFENLYRMLLVGDKNGKKFGCDIYNLVLFEQFVFEKSERDYRIRY